MSGFDRDTQSRRRAPVFEPSAPFPAKAPARSRIVVAHPDGQVRRRVSRAFRGVGVGAVTEAWDGRQVTTVLARWQLREGRNADLLVTALDLPGVSGTDLAEELPDSCWSVPLILLAPADKRASLARSAPDAEVVSWPCELEDLLTVALFMLRRGRPALAH